jgi:hypothetical protein
MTGSPSSPFSTTPTSSIEAASEPAVRLVRPKQGMCSPLASLGRYSAFCASVPYSSRSSPGPSELGTMMVTPTATDRADTFETTSE